VPIGIAARSSRRAPVRRASSGAEALCSADQLQTSLHSPCDSPGPREPATPDD
jgi:hypothetical protein